MAVINSAPDFADIRAVLGDDLTTTSLPDATIQRDIFLGLAEDVILDRLGITESEFSSLAPKAQLKAKRAIKYLTAIYIYPTLDTIIQETTSEVVIRKAERNISNTIAIWQTIVDTEVPEPDGTAAGDIPIFFGTL